MSATKPNRKRAAPALLEARMLDTQRRFPHLKAPALRAGLGTKRTLDAEEFALKLFLSRRRTPV